MLFPPELDVNVLRRFWEQLAAMRGPGESYSDVILALAGSKKPRARQRRGAVKLTITSRALHGGRAGDGKDRSAPRRCQTPTNGGATINPDAPGVRSRSQRRLVDDPQDPIRVWIDKDAVTIDEGGAHSTWLRHNGRIARHHLAGRGGTRETRAFLRRYGVRPVWPSPLGRARLRRRGRFEFGPTLPPTGPWSCEKPADGIVSMAATSAIREVRIERLL